MARDKTPAVVPDEGPTVEELKAELATLKAKVASVEYGAVVETAKRKQHGKTYDVSAVPLQSKLPEVESCRISLMFDESDAISEFVRRRKLKSPHGYRLKAVRVDDGDGVGKSAN